MTYKVVITPPAKHQLEMYISYTISEFKNVQAARAIKDDARKTKIRLSQIANSLPLCEDKELAQHGYRKIMFVNHNFFMIYRIDNNTVIVDAMYHELQDCSSIFTNQINNNKTDVT